ncbi:MAG TPA: TerB family tellurite resistance protein [Oligoflexia bacterium]|nr:TerB family tellurite resistance protein [Oligoflexia bacterium]
MLENIKDFLKGETSLKVNKGGEPTSKDLAIATGMLLLEMAGADLDYAPEEVRTIFAALEKHLNVSDTETLEILEQADKLRQQEGKFDEFLGVINANFDEKQKQLILAMVWKVIIADELIDKYEQRFASELRQRLQLSREAADAAKQMALAGKV